MKKAIALLLALLLSLVALAGCADGEDEEQSIRTSGKVLASFESTVTVTGIEPVTGGEPTRFKSTIDVADIRLSDALEGKTVKSVKFIDESTVELVLTGKATALQEDQGFGKITVSKNALENECDAFDFVVVEKAYIVASSAMSVSATGMYMATYTLAEGSFTEHADKLHIALADGADGRISEVTLADGALTVKVTGASACPTLIFDAETTSFGREFSISLSAYAKATLE